MFKVDESRDLLIKYSQFVMNRESDNIRMDFYKSLIESSFFINNNHATTIDEINNTLTDEYKLEVIPIQILNEALKLLIEENKIIIIEGKYLLNEERYKKICIMLEEKKGHFNLLGDLYESILKEMDETINGESITLLKNHFYTYLNSIFTAKSILTSITLTGENVKNESFLKELLQILESCDQIIENSYLKELQRNAIRKFFSKNEPIIEEYLITTLMNYIYFEVMSYDPELSKLETRELENHSYFLDTNVIYDLIFESRGRHDLVKELVNLSNRLKVKLYYTNLTKEEFIDYIIYSIGEYNALIKNVGFKGIQKISHNNDLIYEYAINKKRNPSLEFEGFCIKYEKEIDKMLASKYVNYIDVNFDILKEDPNFYSYNRTVLECAKKWNLYKNQKVIYHDAVHLMHINNIRKEEEHSLFGPKTWFCTNDSSLYCVSESFKTHKEIPLSVRGDILFDILTLLAPKKIYDERIRNISDAFYDFCKESLTIPLKRIDINRLKLIAGPWMDFDGVSIDTIAEVVSNRFVKKYISEAQRALEYGKEPEPPEPVIEKALDEIMTKQSKEIEKLKIDQLKLTEDIEKLKKDKSELDTNKKELESDLHKLEIEKVKLANKIESFSDSIKVISKIISVVIFAITWFVSYNYFLLSQTPERSFVFSITLAIIIGYILGLKGFKFLINKIFKV